MEIEGRFDGYRNDPKIADLHPHREKSACDDYIWLLFDKLEDLRQSLNNFRVVKKDSCFTFLQLPHKTSARELTTTRSVSGDGEHRFGKHTGPMLRMRSRR
jgi:hypothetical protein